MMVAWNSPRALAAQWLEHPTRDATPAQNSEIFSVASSRFAQDYGYKGRY